MTNSSLERCSIKNLRAGKPVFIAAIILAAAFATLVCSPETALAAPRLAGRVTGVSGRVDVLRAGALRATPIKLGDEVFLGDIVRTKSDGRIELTMIDKSVLRLGHDSRFGIERYQFKTGHNRRVTVKLYRGEAGFKVPRYALQNNRFHLKTRTAVAGIRGTAGYLFSDEMEGVYVTKGLVKFGNRFGSVLVGPGQFAELRAGQPPIVLPFTPGALGNMQNGVTLKGNGSGNGGTPPPTSGTLPPPLGGTPGNNVFLPPGTGVGGLPTVQQTTGSTPVNINVNVQ